jgi:hypothetical protein
MKYEAPTLQNLGAIEQIVLETSLGKIPDSGTEMGASTKIASVLDID